MSARAGGGSISRCSVSGGVVLNIQRLACSSSSTTGIRSWNGAMSSFAVVVTIVNVRCHSPGFGCHDSYSPAMSSSRPSGRWNQNG